MKYLARCKSAALAIMLLLASAGNAGAYGISGTIPVLHIDTKDNVPITSKTVYVDATYYIDHAGSNDIGTASEPLPLQIRGRGNSSWRGTKKPYKLKLGDKQKLLGMKKNRHWALLHGAPWERTLAGFELGKTLDMDWTPSVRPLEVVLNGDYIGMYLLAETVRTDSRRVDIEEQPDMCTNPDSLSGGWLVEIDNYSDEHQIIVPECTQWKMRVTWHTPELLSTLQRDWLREEFTQMNADIYAPEKDDSLLAWHIDLEAMAKFFIVQEVMDNPDGFHGSFYLTKEYGEDTRWKAGPLWDLTCMEREKTDYTYKMKVSYTITPHWINELLKYGSFRDAVNTVWHDFYPFKAEELLERLDERCSPDIYSKADAANNERWPNANYKGQEEKLGRTKYWLRANMEWFDAHLPQPSVGISSVSGNSTPPADGIYTTDGRKVGTMTSGIYIVRQNGKTRKVVRRQ